MLDNVPELTIGRGNLSRRLFIPATAALSLITLVGSLSLASIKVAALVVVAWTALIWICIQCIRKRFDRIVMTWLLIFPFCYYLFSFPRERAVFTVDRAFLLLVLLTLISASRYPQFLPRQTEIRFAGYLWAAYLSVCLLSLLGHPVLDVLSSYRLILDGMLMPALLGLYALRFFPVVKNLKRLHACVCILMLNIATVAGIELLTGTNLLPAPGAVETWVQTGNAKLIRVDGPFENSSVLCVIGILGFLLIVYSRHLLGDSLTTSQRWLHVAGVLASLASALMPMNRGLVIALLVCACMDYFAPEPLVSRGTWNGILAALLLFTLVGKLFYPSVYEDRVTSQANFYQRIAQNLQTLEVIRDHPLMGVGFALYHDAVLEDSKYEVQWGGLEAMNAPHNSLSAVLAEEGGIGFLLYVSAQLLFVRAMFRLRSLNRLGWRTFLYCVLVYTVFGLDVGIAYYSDLNLFYMFVLGIVLQIQLHMLPGEPSDGFDYR
jgi:O-Antigen ligase